jgi:sortase A
MFSLAAVPNKLVFLIGIILLIPGLLLLTMTFFPVIKAETIYQIQKTKPPVSAVTPANPDFNIYIPKINANAPVVKNVNPNISEIYQSALSQGVAHALGSALPNQPGNTFIFAHSAGNWYQANRYNAVFYLLNKLVVGDEIILTYLGNPRRYLVSKSQIVSASDLSYMAPSKTDLLTLMTCWPPGTTLKRLIVVAKPVN